MEIIARIEKGQFHSWIDRQELNNSDYHYRCINIAIFNHDGKILVQQRSQEKTIQPLHWDISVAGHIPKEDYPNEHDDGYKKAREKSAHRELLEELGIETNLIFVMETQPAKDYHREYISFFVGIYEGPFQLQIEEVAQVQFVDLCTLTTLQPKTKQLQWMMNTKIIHRLANYKVSHDTNQ